MVAQATAKGHGSGVGAKEECQPPRRKNMNVGSEEGLGEDEEVKNSNILNGGIL